MTDRFEPPHPAISSLIASGFPFRIAVARNVASAPNCRLLGEEFPWRDAGGDDRFLDIVVAKHHL